MCVLYLMTSGSKVRKSGGRILVEKDGERLASVPLMQVESIVATEYCQITTQVIYVLLEQGVQISYVDGLGRIKGIVGGAQENADKLLKQIECFQDLQYQLELGRKVLRKKLEGQRGLLKSYARSKGKEDLLCYAEKIQQYCKKMKSVESLDELRGLEGMASRVYFSAFPRLLKKKGWNWSGRNRRPAQDPVNALLNYGYAFLEHEVRIALAGAGMDARIGFFHSNNGRKDSLVFDLMELFRQKVTDRMVLKGINCDMFTLAGFEQSEKGCRLEAESRKEWFAYYEKYMRTETQEYDGKSPREWIRQEIYEFSRKIWANKEKAA